MPLHPDRELHPAAAHRCGLGHHRLPGGGPFLQGRQQRVPAGRLHRDGEHSGILAGGHRLMIAALSGTAIVADLGARQVRQELEALSVMGLSNVLFIVVPRAVALMLMTALYNVPMIIFTTLSGFFIAVAVVGVNPGAFLASFFTQGTLVDLFGGEIKCILFGALVAAICIYKGIGAKGGAEGLAPAVHSVVVWCFVGIQALEYLYTPTVLALFHSQNVLR